MEMITGNTVQGNVMRSTDEELLLYQEDLMRSCLLRSLADAMKEKGILSASEHREFLSLEAKKNSLDPFILAR